jgi:hypothetical protein
MARITTTFNPMISPSGSFRPLGAAVGLAAGLGAGAGGGGAAF